MININVTQKLYKKFDHDENGHLKQNLEGSNAPANAVDITPFVILLMRRSGVCLVKWSAIREILMFA